MFRSKKGGAPGEKVDVGKALGEMDKEVLKQVGGEMAQTGKKEVSHHTQHTPHRERTAQHRHSTDTRASEDATESGGRHAERHTTQNET
eukprot:COSAG02_NODE_30_length_50867_cov_66.594331_20_plen_89_part_00